MPAITLILLALSNLTPAERRQGREEIVARVPSARALVEQYEDAVAACRNLGNASVQKLAAWEGLARITSATTFLRLIAAQKPRGDELLLWCLTPEHTEMLTDIDNFQALTEQSEEVYLNLTPLPQLGAKVRARRLSAEPAPRNTVYAFLDQHGAPVGMTLACVVLVLAVWHRLKLRGQQPNFPIAPRP